MGKAHVTAIIQALQETIENLSVNGCSSRAKITNPTVDSQYVENLEDGYGDDIQDIIDNIPDVPPTPPGPTLPTIEKIQSKYGSTAPSITFDPGVKADLYYSSNSNLITYDSAKVYIYRGKIVNDSGEWDARLTYQLYAYNNNGVVAVENISSDWGVSAEGWLFSCDDPSVDVIYVKRTADSKLFWAFKKTVDGTDYYFVLSQSDWTDNLSSIGFETSSVQPDLPVKLPSVTTINVSLSALGLSKSLANDETSALYNSSSGYSQVLYDASKVYATVYMSASTIWHSGFPLENGYGVVTVRNKTGSTMTIYGGIIAQCDNASASVVTVYNSSNTVYNAFKYTVDGTDYYYVLDGTQSDWTDDLSSIGYHLPAQLPTVSLEGDFAAYNWLRVSPSAESISSGANTSNLTFDGTVFPDYDASKSYGILQWQQTGGTNSGRVEFSIANASGKIQAHNDTSGTLTFYQARVAVCSSSDATVVPVYDSSNNAYNAFKYTEDNVDYYWVLDGTQADWTDDLSSIGYSLTLVFPTVSITGDISVGNWVYPVGGEASLASNATVTVKDDFSSGSTIAFNTNVCYAVRNWYTDSSNTGTNGSISVVSVSNNLGVKNDTNSTLNFYAARIGVCSSNQATVVIVYNSQNNPYNAFKYTLSGTDYYYVLDGTQADWTDDLSSIGYHLPVQNPSCYFTSQGASATSDFRFEGSTNYYMYDASGQMIAYDTSKTYTIIAKYNKEGQSVTGDFADGIKFVNSNGYLGTVRNWSSGPAYLFRIEYTVS